MKRTGSQTSTLARCLFVLSPISILLILGIPTILLPTTRAQIPESSNVTTNYTDPNHGYRLQYPSGWLHTYVLGGVPAFLPRPAISTGFAANLVVTVQSVPQGMRLDQVKTLELNQNQQKLPDYVLISDDMTTLGGLPAHKVEYTWNAFGMPIAQISAFTLTNNTLYSLTFSARSADINSYIQNVQKIFDSFQLK